MSTQPVYAAMKGGAMGETGSQAGMRTVAVYPGTFDPVTYGHLDIVRRAAAQFDRLVVACLRNLAKRPMFTADERAAMVAETTGDLDNVETAVFDGLLVDFCATRGIGVVVKGLRAVTDFEYELQMAQTNLSLSGVETFFLTTNPAYSYLSSSLVREVAAFDHDLTEFVPKEVAHRLRHR